MAGYAIPGGGLVDPIRRGADAGAKSRNQLRCCAIPPLRLRQMDWVAYRPWLQPHFGPHLPPQPLATNSVLRGGELKKFKESQGWREPKPVEFLGREGGESGVS